MNLKPYPEYKDSGVAWLGKVPRHWEVCRIKNHIKETDNRSVKGEEVLLSMTRRKGIIRYSDRTNKPPSAKSLIGYKICHANQIVMNRMQAWSGMFFTANETGIISPDYAIFNAKCEDNVHFLCCLFRSPFMIEQFAIESKGIGSGFNRLYTEKLGSIYIALPNRLEQNKIIDFVKFKTAQIARFIKAKKRMIELLKEQKQVIINDAVTGKIDVATGKPYPKYKDSGVEWLGQVPEGWEVLPLRRCSKMVKTGGTPLGALDNHFTEDGFNWYTPGDFVEDMYLIRSSRRLSPLGKKNVTIFPPNTIMMIGIGATIGKVCISKDYSSCNQQINAILSNDKISLEYLTFYLRLLRTYILACGKFTTLPIINQDETKNLPILVPRIKEQLAITIYSKAKTATLDLTISRTEHEIALIQEYRTRLISDVVTGKIDVRDIEIPDIDDTMDELTGETAGEEELEIAEVEE